MAEWGAALVALLGAGGLFLQHWASAGKARAEAAEIRCRLEMVREQVGNNHQTNLRDDIDRVTHLVSEVDRSVARLSNRIDELEQRVRML